jgi:Mn2+/Fe2+ NRAMP family transporter
MNLGADIGAMGAALALLVGGPPLLYAAAFGALCVGLEVFMSYHHYAAVLKWLTLSLFAYVATVLVVEVPVGEALAGALLPRLEFDAAQLTALVAVLGTTISPYLFFWQSAQEVEELRSRHAKPLCIAPREAGPELHRIRVDTLTGMGVSNLIALFIIIAAGATLHAGGVTDIETSAQAAEALRPIAGVFAFAVFAAGIVGCGLLAVPVLAGSAAYALGEALHWPVGLDRRPADAKAFYLTIALSTLVGVALNFTTVDPIKALYWSAVLNGLLAPPLMAVMMALATNRRVMGRLTLTRPLRLAGWASTAVMAAAALAMIVSWIGD